MELHLNFWKKFHERVRYLHSMNIYLLYTWSYIIMFFHISFQFIIRNK